MCKDSANDWKENAFSTSRVMLIFCKDNPKSGVNDLRNEK